MIRNMEEQKAKAKEKMEKALDEYFNTFEKASNQKGFNINKIEQLTLENQMKMRAVLEEAAGKLSIKLSAHGTYSFSF